MPGMNSGVNVNDPTVIAAFKSALLHQGIIALLIFGVLGLAWLTVRAWWPAAPEGGGQTASGGQTAVAPAEPSWRQWLRVGFGLLWVFDGILQAQPKMAIGLPSQVIQPAAASSPHWVQHVVNWAGTSWSYHPMQAGAAAVWIQIGIGVWLLAAPRGSWSRLAGLVSVGWGLVVWVFGESFGGVFAPGLTWLFGAPGAVLIYVVAGALIALPERVWHDPRLGQAILSGLGLFLVAMAVLQAWPGRGFWQGVSHGQPGTLAGMTASMAPTPQPHFLSSWINAFTGFDEAHGFAVNLFTVVALALIGGIFLTGQRRLVRPAVIAFTVLCVADWVLIEDFGFFGGLGTDPNSMIPFALLAISGYLALAPAAVTAAKQASAAVPEAAPAAAASAAPAAGWRDRVRPASLRRTVATASLGTVASVGALGLIILGAAPMAAAQASRERRPDPGRVDLRVVRAAELPGQGLRAHRPARPDGEPGQPARQGGADHLPGPGVHDRLPADRAGVPRRRAAPRPGLPQGGAGRGRRQPRLPPGRRHSGVRPRRAAEPGAELAVPDRQRAPAPAGVEGLRALRRDPARRLHDRPPGHCLRHRPGGARPRRARHRSGPATTATKSSFAVLLANAARQVLRSS